MTTRRELLKLGLLTGAGLLIGGKMPAHAQDAQTETYPSKRPAPGNRRFTSEAVEETIRTMQGRIADPKLAWLFSNCYPNTLDTTVHYQEIGGKPDTFVITGDIDAMWLRDSSAQVWPYLPLAKQDPKLQSLLHGVLNRQVQCIELDPYANAFNADPDTGSQWDSDYTLMKPGIHERKWEIDSLCYPIRLGYGYWKETGDTSPFDARWESAMGLILQTFHEQQRLDGPGPYTFQRGGRPPAPGSEKIYGSPIKPNGLICSRFRPSDDATKYQFLIPSNFFAVVSLNHLAEMLSTIRHNSKMATQATEMAQVVRAALAQHAVITDPMLGKMYAYEVDGLGNSLIMDDANVPNLVSLPYLGAVPDSDPIYKTTRRMAGSIANPWYFEGKFDGGGSPHTGQDTIWPIAVTMFGLTSHDEAEVAHCLRTLKDTDAGTGFMHESFNKDDPAHFSRPWFAWANTLFGEFVLHTNQHYPQLLQAGPGLV